MITLLDGEDRPTAAHWKDLFAEAERKVAAVMDNKSWLLLSTADVFQFSGKFFFFVNGRRPRSRWLGGANYDHQIFLDSLAELTPALEDADKKIVRVDAVSLDRRDQLGLGSVAELFFDQSLEAHQVTFAEEGKPESLYWALETEFAGQKRNYEPQKKYGYAMCELVIEGDHLESITIEKEWQKYRFFRIHNLNAYDVAVTFDAYDRTVTVPKYECRAVRLDVDDDDWNYFFPFKSGDLRFFEMPLDRSTPAGTMGANNVCAPMIAFKVLKAFAQTRGLGGDFFPGPKLRLDPHVLEDLSELYHDFYPKAADEEPAAPPL